MRLPEGVRGVNLRLLVSGRTAAVTKSRDWCRFELPTLLDHEVAVLE
jgi:hypothetical protein